MAESLSAVIKSLNKDFKNELIIKGENFEDCEKLPLTSPRLNYILHGGIPIGRLIEFYGDEGGGKSSCGLDAVGRFQKKNDGRTALWVDVEQTFDREWAEKIGVDVDSLLLYKPDETQGAETILESILTLVKTGEIGFVVIDSIGALSSEKELDEKTTLSDKQYGGIAIPLTKFAKQMIPIAARYKCTVIGINQERELINSPYGGKRTVGGKGWKFDVSLRMNFRKGTSFDSNYKTVTNSEESPVGHRVEVSMTKSKNGAADRRNGFFTLRYDVGIDALYDLIDMAINKFEIIEKSGAWFTIPGVEKPIQGQDKVYKYLEEHSDILQKIQQQVEEKIQ